MKTFGVMLAAPCLTMVTVLGLILTACRPVVDIARATGPGGAVTVAPGDVGDNASRPPSTPEPPKPTPDATCPRLAPGLRYLADSADPLAVADAAKIERQGNRLRLELRTTARDGYLLDAYGIIVEQRSPLTPNVVALVPVPSLCAVSNDPAVEREQRIEPSRIGPHGIPTL